MPPEIGPRRAARARLAPHAPRLGRVATSGAISRWAAAIACSILVADALGCGQTEVDPRGWDGSIPDLTPREPAPVDAGDARVIEDDGAVCTVDIENHPDEGYQHISCTSPATYLTVPPSSGNHYPIWAAYETYANPIPWGNLVHSLEHGAVIVVYNCPGGCPDEVARAQAWIDALPPDATCGTNRAILVPDPTMDVRWAATAWTWTLRADCFDSDQFTFFFQQHYGQGREVICGGGADTPDGLCPPP